jgi:hypothetical protein
MIRRHVLFAHINSAVVEVIAAAQQQAGSEFSV